MNQDLQNLEKPIAFLDKEQNTGSETTKGALETVFEMDT